jgi:hypothetical protein
VAEVLGIKAVRHRSAVFGQGQVRADPLHPSRIAAVRRGTRRGRMVGSAGPAGRRNRSRK